MKRTSVAAVSLGVGLLLATDADAGGLYLPGAGAVSTSRAGAAVASADDGEAFVLNPAGLAKTKGTTITVSAAIIDYAMKFSRRGDYDYIEGGSAKGTVERITLRTVALRHQNGPLHFVPYGALGAVRNNSRDWVIDKFELPLSPEVDSERVRKLIKSIGQQMLEDPELAPLMLDDARGGETWVEGTLPASPLDDSVRAAVGPVDFRAQQARGL